MKEFKKYGIWVVILFVLYVIAKLTTPEDTNWEKTLQDDDKNPFGTYILKQSLSDLFPNKKVSNIKLPVYNFIEDNYHNDGHAKVYIALAPSIELTKKEIPLLLDFIKDGNYALISSDNFGNRLWDSLGISGTTLYFNFADSSRVNLVDSSYRIAKGYSFYAATIDNYFDSLSKKNHIETLGYIDQGMQPNFIKIPMGKGAILIHASPLCFSNAFILRNNNYQYVQQALSYIPKNVSTVYWDQYYSNSGGEEAQTPFRYFLSHFWLRFGLYLTTYLLILYVFFAGKRRQRIIPIMTAPKNTTAQFIETISSLYYNQKSGPEIFEKKVQHWLAYIRNHLQLSTEDITANDFWEKLSTKSGIDLSEIHRIRDEIAVLQNNYSDKVFMELYQHIEDFYKKTS